MLNRQGDLLDEYYNSALEARNKSGKVKDAADISKAEAAFGESLRKTCKHVVDGFDRVKLMNNGIDTSEDNLGNINTWQLLFASRVENLQLHTVQDELVKTLDFAVSALSFFVIVKRNQKNTTTKLSL